MSGIGFPNNLNPETTKVLDNRCAGVSSGTNSITYPAQGLLRYETDTDNWKYYDNTNNWVNFSTGVTYTSGEGVSISPSNVISIGQPVDETDDVTFNSVTTNSVKGQNNGDLEFRTITSSVENVRMTITNTGRVGINVAANDIQEDFEIDGNIQLDTGGVQRSKIIFYDKQNDHEHAEVDGLGEGTNGGVLALYTKVDGGSVTEKLRINNVGAIGIGGANYGTTNQVLISNGSGSAVTWANQIDTLDDLGDVTLTAVTTGDLLKYNGTNFINFAPTYLDGAGISDNYLIKVVGGATTQTSLYETSVANTSTSLKTYIPGTPFSVLAGSIETEFFGTTAKRRMHLTTSGIESVDGITITSDGKVGIGVVEPNEVLQIDGKLRIEDDTTQTLTFYDTQDGSTKENARIEVNDDGGGADILFYTRPSAGNPPTEKLRINKTGAIGIAGANYGTTNQVLISNGSGSAVTWADQTDTTYSAGTGISISPSNVISIGQPVAFKATSTVFANYVFNSGTPLFSAQLNNVSGHKGSFNIGGGYNTSTGYFTAPSAGIYYFNGLAQWKTSAFNATFVRILITTPATSTSLDYALLASQYGANEPFNANFSQDIAGIISLAENDVIGFYVYANNAPGAAIVLVTSYFMGYKLY